MSVLRGFNNSDKCFIVFEELPTTFPMSDSSTQDGMLKIAEKFAERKALETGKRYTVMLVHNDSLDFAITAVNKGVVFHDMESLMEEES